MKIRLNRSNKMTLKEVLETENVPEGELEKKLKSSQELNFYLNNTEISLLIEKLINFIDMRYSTFVRFKLIRPAHFEVLPIISEVDDEITVKTKKAQMFFNLINSINFVELYKRTMDGDSFDDIYSDEVDKDDTFANLMIGRTKGSRKIIIRKDSVELNKLINEMLYVAYLCIMYPKRLKSA